jgi:hypothetical protein
MAPEISADPKFWKSYDSGKRKYFLWRSCKYDPAPGESAPPSEGNLSPCLTVWIFVHELRSGEEEPIGKISTFAYRDRWKGIAHLNSDVEADNQLEQAAISARNGIWKNKPLTRMLNQGFKEIRQQINDYENYGSKISGEFPLQ